MLTCSFLLLVSMTYKSNWVIFSLPLANLTFLVPYHFAKGEIFAY